MTMRWAAPPNPRHRPRPLRARLAGLCAGVPALFVRYVPTDDPIVFDPARAERWRLMVEAADRIDLTAGQVAS